MTEFSIREGVNKEKKSLQKNIGDSENINKVQIQKSKRI